MPRRKLRRRNQQGFALIATISIMSLVVMLALALVSLTTRSTRQASYGKHRERARANARLALAEAVAALQQTMGKDQAVCATASIFESGIDESNYINNRNWLGTWKTTTSFQGLEWPVVGKKPDLGDRALISPYPYKGIYSDLRHTDSSLTDNAWKTELQQAWLVSGGDTADLTIPLDPDLDENVLLVGEGSLGSIVAGNTSLFQKQRVVVPSVSIYNGTGVDKNLNGRYAYWISNNNTRAKITQPSSPAYTDVESPVGSGTFQKVSSKDIMVPANPASTIEVSSNKVLDEFVFEHSDDFEKVITDNTLALLPLYQGLSPANEEELRERLKSKFFDFTTFAYGLHTNVQKGGFKRDLTPLLFGDDANKTIYFDLPYGNPDGSRQPFKSDYPIIPGERKAVVGPSFSALRDWGLKRYMTGLSTGRVSAETQIPSSDLKFRNDSKWARGSSDGYGIDMSKWGESAPKVNPVMTAATWHIGFSSTSKDGGNLRFHIVPKVEMWNPYNVKVTMPKLAVILPNYFRHYGANGAPSSSDNYRVQFYVSNSHALALKGSSTSSRIQSWPITSGSSSVNDFSMNDGSNYYTFFVNAKTDGGNAPWAPRGRFIGFTLESVTFEPGQCLVFSPEIGGPGADIQLFSETNIESNLLSPSSQFGEDSFYMQPSLGNGTEVRLQKTSGPKLTDSEVVEFINRIDFSEVFRFRLNTNVHMNPHASLKSSSAGSFSTSADVIADSSSFPTIQLISCGQGGTHGGEFWQRNVFADDRPYLPIVDSDTNPDAIDFPRRFQSGVKLSWLDESFFDGNDQESYRFHPDDGLQSGAIPFHHAIFAHGSVRPQIVTRAPHHYSQMDYNSFFAGSWFASYAAVSATASDIAELPSFVSGKFTKNPFGAASQHDVNGQAVMFQLPDLDEGCLSLAALRHANISPFSWQPTYIIGESLAELGAPADSSAHSFLEDRYIGSSNQETTVSNSFDFYNGGTRSITRGNRYSSKRWWSNWTNGAGSKVRWGPSTGTTSGRYGFTNNETIIHMGNEAVTKEVDGVNISSEDPILVYDTSFEVNQNLFDDYFLSGMQIDLSNKVKFDWNYGDDLDNPFHSINQLASINATEMESKLEEVSGPAGRPAGLAFGFWNNGYLLVNEAQFNVNSTSVDAWTAILSGMRDMQKIAADDSTKLGGKDQHLITRVRRPLGADPTANLDPSTENGFSGGRILSDAEITSLAENIVKQVKLRGPFLSLSDFVNRRLGDPGSIGTKATPSYAPSYKTYAGDDDVTTRYGALEAAIMDSGLNDLLEDNPQAAAGAYDTATKDSTSNEYGWAGEPNRGYGVHTDWQADYTYRQISSKMWGAPSYITQGDILTPIAPKLSVRGDTFTIRACGQSVENGIVEARAYLEAVVVRSSEYVEAAPISLDDAGLDPLSNRSTTPAILVNQRTGELEFNKLSAVNASLGRKFKVISVKWLQENEL